MTDAAFWDRIAPRYAKRPVSDPGAYEETLTRVRSYLKPTDTVLELGCGTGTTALKLCDGTGDYTASDISPGMIGIAKDRAGDTPGVEFMVGGIDRAAYDGRTFDAVLAFNLLHLVPDLDAALATIRGLLPEDGLFISKTPAVGAKWYFRPVVGALRLIGKAPYVRFLKVEEVDRRIEAAGFKIVETGLYPPSTPSRFVVARKV